MKETKKTYAERFKTAIQSGEPIMNKLGEEYIFKEDILFECAYSRKDKARRSLPKYWCQTADYLR